jgi:hypothetical protein
MTDISDNQNGYDGNLSDFQMIVPEAVSGGATSYYFYAELR